MESKLVDNAIIRLPDVHSARKLADFLLDSGEIILCVGGAGNIEVELEKIVRTRRGNSACRISLSVFRGDRMFYINSDYASNYESGKLTELYPEVPRDLYLISVDEFIEICGGDRAVPTPLDLTALL